MKKLPPNYEEKVYAGVLGKIIGVYLGRPFEGWTYDQIIQNLGEINYYVHEKLNVPLIVTDDDISGTFTFLRALPDHGNSPAIRAEEIGKTWLNYLIENKTILWWGGLGNSTEHTAYLRLKNGITPPESGSMRLNSRVVAEQIGAQIFIDGWAMVAPGDPEKAAELARQASSVSHDGEAIYGAQVLAAMESAAFVESDLNQLIDVAVAQIPRDSVIYRLIEDLRSFQTKESDWKLAHRFIEVNYGYDRYGGNCHMVPNHALIIMSLLYGGDDFQQTLKIVNTCGWDTDCNSGNVGCLMGIKKGLACFENGPDFRGPVADRIFLPTADGGRSISDAVREAGEIINIGAALAGEQPIAYKDGARFHFSFPGSVQGFCEETSISSKGTTEISNSILPGSDQRGLRISYHDLAIGREARVGTDTFIPEEYAHLEMHYEFLASPTLYAGQKVRAAVLADKGNTQTVDVAIYIQYYGNEDKLFYKRSPARVLNPGERSVLDWIVPDMKGAAIAKVGLELTSQSRNTGTIYLDFLTWDGAPEVNLTKPEGGGAMWRRAWVNAVDVYSARYPENYRLIQNEGRGLLSQGTRDWQDYTLEAVIVPHMMTHAGLGFRYQGLERYYAVLIGEDRKVRLIKRCYEDQVMAIKDLAFEWDDAVALKCKVTGQNIKIWVNDQPFFDLEDQANEFTCGGVALIVEEGRMCCEAVKIHA